jgi:uncharacterized protein (TIGR03083 family)
MSDPTEHAAVLTQIADLRAEGDELDAVLRGLDEDVWTRVTAFKDWTVHDVIAHLHLSDQMGLTSLEGEDAFRALMRQMRYAGRWRPGLMAGRSTTCCGCRAAMAQG